PPEEHHLPTLRVPAGARARGTPVLEETRARRAVVARRGLVRLPLAHEGGQGGEASLRRSSRSAFVHRDPAPLGQGQGELPALSVGRRPSPPYQVLGKGRHYRRVPNRNHR